MPNRIIKETIAKSERVSGLTDFQFRLWVHLITYVDDYGRGDARSAIIRGACFPLHSRMKNRDIENGLAALAAAGCIRLYEAEGRPYLYFPTWDKHQRVRQKVSKCPDPESCDELQQAAADGGEMLQKAARIQNPNPNPNPKALRGRTRRLRDSGQNIPARRERRKQGPPLRKRRYRWIRCCRHWSSRSTAPSGPGTTGSIFPMRLPGWAESGGRTRWPGRSMSPKGQRVNWERRSWRPSGV